MMQQANHPYFDVSLFLAILQNLLQHSVEGTITAIRLYP
jgi:hypothetical protein